MSGRQSEQFPSSAAAGSFLLCPKCKAKACLYLRSGTADNPGRHFYKCSDSNHSFFKWADQVKPHELIQVPHCGGCGAGVCRVKIETDEPDKGRIMFMCRVKEGEGSCGYRIWQDELQISGAGAMMNNTFPSKLVKCSKTNTSVIDVDEENNQRDEGTDPVSPLMEPSDDVICHEVISCKTDRYKCVEGKSRTTSRRPPKRSHCGDMIASDIPVSASFSTIGWSDLNFMSDADCWMVDVFCQNLSSELNGWWGRLVFRPMRCLMAHESKPSIPSSLSHPLESTFVVQDILVKRCGSITLSRNSKGVERYIELSFDVERHRSPTDSACVVQENILVNPRDGSSTSTRGLLGADTRSKPVTMSKSISNVFHNAAECLQDELVTHLEKMDAKDHEAMRKEAEATFAALDCLAFDYKDFKKRIEEMIHCASRLVEIDRAMPTGDSLQKLVQICSSERERLDKINCVHAEAIEADINNKKRIEILREEISSTKEWLFQIEAEVSCCEVEMRSLELELDKISKNKEVLEGKYLMASKEVEESRKLLEQNEAEQNAAKAKFNQARASLRR